MNWLKSWLNPPKIYGIVQRNEHGSLVVRPLGTDHGLLPGALVEIIPVDSTMSPDVQAPTRNEPIGMAA